MTTAHLRPCPACLRHLRVSEEACPFCGARVDPAFRAAPRPRAPTGRLTRAALVAFGGGTAVFSYGCNKSQVNGGGPISSVDGSVLAPPYGGVPILVDAADVSSCLAAGGECSETPCEFGISASCGADGAGFCCVPCQAYPGVHRILASNYTQTCTVDSDCVAVGVGDPCQACNILCASNAAINRSSLTQYRSDVASSPALGDAASCGCQPTTLSACCNSGTCDPSCGVDGSAGALPPVDADVSDANDSFDAEDTGPNGAD